MKVSECMTRDVLIADTDASIRKAAQAMASIDAGILPVAEDDRLVGMITDRDIAIRAVAQGKGPDTPVREVMSSEKVLYCYDDEELDHVAKNMSEQQVRRLPVVDRDKRLVGIISFGDLAQKETRAAGKAAKGITKPGGAHQQ